MTHHVSQRMMTALRGWETGADRDPKTGRQRLLPRGTPALRAYRCPAGAWTIGWGATGADIGPATVWTREKCEAQLAAHVIQFEAAVRKLIGDALTTAGQFDALVSFAYNCGSAALKSSTLLKRHLAGDIAGAAAQFPRWNKVGGVVSPGLIERRATERGWYEGGKR